MSLIFGPEPLVRGGAEAETVMTLVSTNLTAKGR